MVASSLHGFPANGAEMATDDDRARRASSGLLVCFLIHHKANAC